MASRPLPLLVAAVLLAAAAPSGAASGDDPARDTAAEAGTKAAPSGTADADEGRPPVFYETTTVTARPVSSASGAVRVIDSDELDEKEARSGTDALADVPGLNLLSTGGRAGLTHAWIRGADPNFTLVLLDGIPLNDSTDQQGGAVNFEEMPASLVDRVEVVRGPQTAFYGMSGLSGVVQLFTPRGGPGPVNATLGAEAGNASLRRGFGTASGPIGEGGWSAGGSWDEESHRIALESFEQLDVRAGTELVLGPGATLSLTGRVATGRQDDYPDSSGGPVYGSGELRHTGHDDLALGGTLLLGPTGGRRHRVGVFVQRRGIDRTSPAIPPLVPESTEDTTYTRLRLAWQVPLLGGGRTRVDVGASADGEWAVNDSVLKLPDFLGGDVPGSYDEGRWSGGAFGILRHQAGSVLLEAALRLDEATGDSLQVHPHLGVVWSPGSGDTHLRASVGRASKLPSFFALASPPALGGNPDLQPERTIGGEVGVEHRFAGPRLSTGAAFFLHEYRDLVDFDFDLFTHVNRAKVRAKGVELTLAWQPVDSLRLAAEATWLDAEDLSGDPLLYEPHWMGSGSVTFRPDDRLRLRLDLRSVSSYLDNQLPVPDRDTVEGFSLLGFAGSWRVHDGWSVRTRLDNLTDRSYETLIGFPGPGRSFWAGIGWERR